MNLQQLTIQTSGLGVALTAIKSHLLQLKDETDLPLYVRGGYGLLLPGIEGPEEANMPEFRIWVRETLVDTASRPQLFLNNQSPISTIEIFSHFYCPYSPDDLIGIVERRQAFIEFVIDSMQHINRPGDLVPDYRFWKFKEEQQIRIEHTNAFKNHGIDAPIIPPMFVSMIEFDISHTLKGIR